MRQYVFRPNGIKPKQIPSPFTFLCQSCLARSWARVPRNISGSVSFNCQQLLLFSFHICFQQKRGCLFLPRRLCSKKWQKCNFLVSTFFFILCIVPWKVHWRHWKNVAKLNSKSYQKSFLEVLSPFSAPKNLISCRAQMWNFSNSKMFRLLKNFQIEMIA